MLHFIKTPKSNRKRIILCRIHKGQSTNSKNSKTKWKINSKNLKSFGRNSAANLKAFSLQKSRDVSNNISKKIKLKNPSSKFYFLYNFYSYSRFWRNKHFEEGIEVNEKCLQKVQDQTSPNKWGKNKNNSKNVREGNLKK